MQSDLVSLMDELASTYGVEREMVERAISSILASPPMRRITGADFAEMTESGLVVYGRHGVGNLGNPKRSLLRALTHELEKSLQDTRTASEYDRVMLLRNKPARGTIERKYPDGSLLVSLAITGVFGETVDEHFAFCTLRRQPPYERDKYRAGQTLQFHVERVLPVRREDGLSAVIVSLSRTSRDLPALLLSRELPGRKDIRCIRRVVGKISHIEASEYVPKEAILKVGKELNERISVKHHDARQRQELRRSAHAN